MSSLTPPPPPLTCMSVDHVFPHFSFKTAMQHFLPFIKYTFSPMCHLGGRPQSCPSVGLFWSCLVPPGTGCVWSGSAVAPHHRPHQSPMGRHRGKHEREIRKVLKEQLQLHVTGSSQGWSDLCQFKASSRINGTCFVLGTCSVCARSLKESFSGLFTVWLHKWSMFSAHFRRVCSIYLSYLHTEVLKPSQNKASRSGW